MRISGGAPEFSGLVRLMRRPEVMRRQEVAAAELERSRGCMKEQDEEGGEGGNEEGPCPYL